MTSDIKFVSYSSSITMMHGPIYIRFKGSWENYWLEPSRNKNQKMEKE